jgi:hypothetical protein
MAAEFSAGEWAAAVGSIAMVLLVVGFLVALASLSRTLAALRQTLDQFSRETVPLVADLHATVRKADGELERVDSLLATAESVGGTVDAASRLAYLTFSNPVVKALAFGTGVARAGRRFRRTDR